MATPPPPVPTLVTTPSPGAGATAAPSSSSFERRPSDDASDLLGGNAMPPGGGGPAPLMPEQPQRQQSSSSSKRKSLMPGSGLFRRASKVNDYEPASGGHSGAGNNYLTAEPEEQDQEEQGSFGATPAAQAQGGQRRQEVDADGYSVPPQGYDRGIQETAAAAGRGGAGRQRSLLDDDDDDEERFGQKCVLALLHFSSSPETVLQERRELTPVPICVHYSTKTAAHRQYPSCRSSPTCRPRPVRRPTSCLGSPKPSDSPPSRTSRTCSVRRMLVLPRRWEEQEVVRVSARREWRGARRLEDAGELDRLRLNRSRSRACPYLYRDRRRRREVRRSRRWPSDKTATMSRSRRSCSKSIGASLRRRLRR